jgi:hypothetical protein
MKNLALLLLLTAALPVHADEPESLPDDSAKLQAFVTSLIQTGQMASPSISTLTAKGFSCQRQEDTFGPYIWCNRLDGDNLSTVKRRYQVILRLIGDTISDVRSTTDLIGL